MIPKKPSADRVRRRREKLRLAGLRPIQIWLPDAQIAGFSEACERQVKAIRDSEVADAAEQESWFNVSDKAGWTA